MSIVVNKHGHSLNSLQYINDIDELKVKEMCGTNAMLLYENKLVMCWNKYRNNWELPGGGKEEGEDLTQCIIREIYEETLQTATNLEIRCWYKVFIPRINKEINGVTFYGELKEISNFSENEEMNKMILWDMKTNIGDIDGVDLKIVEFILNSY